MGFNARDISRLKLVQNKPVQFSTEAQRPIIFKNITGGKYNWRTIVLIALIVRISFIAWDRLGPDKQNIVSTMLMDNVKLFDSAEQARLNEYHDAILDEFDIDFRIATTDSDNDLNIQAAKLFETSEVGKLSKDKRGLLLVISPNASQVRLEVGRSVEGVFTDAFVSYIERRQLAPFFRAGRVTDGVLATTELIATRAANAQSSDEFDPPTNNTLEGSAGGGATVPVEIGAGYKLDVESKGTAHTIDHPREIAAQYVQAMTRGHSDPSWPLLSKASQKMMSDWVVTKAQMANLAKTYTSCTVHDTQLSAGFAVVRYPIAQRQCAPFFFILEDNKWRLDLTVMTSLIRFNHRNYWHFNDGAGRYDFAFSDWRFDKNGYPM